MKIVLSDLCKQGGREYNQDFVANHANGMQACLVVCDGLGSYVGSEVASQLCATRIVNMYSRVLETSGARAFEPDYVRSYIHTAHSYVADFKEMHPEIRSSCTTVACVVTNGNRTVITHIGDTRVYVFRNNKLVYQTKDHSLSQVAVEMGQISLRDIRTHKDQNKLTRVLGNEYFTEPDCAVDEEPLHVGDSFIICTDGFWEYVYEEEMEADLASSKGNPQEALKKMEKRLLSRVTKFNDNYSAIVATVVEDKGGLKL